MNIHRFTYFVSNNPSGMASPRKIDLLRLTPSPSNIRRAPRKREKLPHVRESKTVLDSGFHAVDSGFKVLDSRSFSVEFRFRIPYAVFRIPKSRILDSSCKNFSDSGIRIPLHNILRVVKAFSLKKVLIKSKSRSWKTYWKPLVLSLRQCAVIVSY